ncbi:MAG TPA: hypothetical protein VM764_10410 [Gemmatimonadaceae bacterium]|nr:hypothetical protein [Gemmatimonadaceae bacterium]
MTTPGGTGAPGAGDGGQGGAGKNAAQTRPSAGRIAAIGCFMAWIGGFSGAMIAVLLSKFVAYVTKAPSCDGIPSCDWYIYAAVGGAIGAISLPWLVVSSLLATGKKSD